jgi:fatty-acyl-CoA synthase
MKLSYAHGTSDTPLLGETIGRNLERIASTFPERDALISCHEGLRYTYRELRHEVSRLSRGLLAMGLAKGDRVALWSPNSAAWVLLQYATADVGVVLVNVNPAYRSHELAYVLRQSGARVIFSASRFKTSDYRAMVTEVRAECPELEEAIFLDDPAFDEVSVRGDAVSTVELEARRASLSPDDPIDIQYTSGTTGFPKGATLSHHAILNNGFFVGELVHYTEHDRICLPVPFYHCFGMVMGNLAATSHGAAIVIPSAGFEPRAALEAVSRERCTSLYGVPTMFIAELEELGKGTYDLSSLRTGIMAGSPCPIEVMKRCVSEMNMAEVAICYGMTETAPVSTQTRREDSLEHRVSTVGTVVPHVEIKIVDPETGITVPRNTVGELCTRGYSVMLGYWNDPKKTDEAVDAAGYMHTGDLATMDDQGFVRIVGRSKDMVIRGGENVYPREIEEFLHAHPEIADVQVIGVPDPKYGEELCAWIRRVEGAALLEEDVRAFCKGKLAHYKVPRYVLFVEEFPMTVTGKVQKYKMREETVRVLGLVLE